VVCFILNNLHNSIFYVNTKSKQKPVFFILFDDCYCMIFAHTHIIQKKAFWGLLSLGKAHEHWKGSFDNGQGQIWQILNFHIQQQWEYFNKKWSYLFYICLTVVKKTLEWIGPYSSYMNNLSKLHWIALFALVCFGPVRSLVNGECWKRDFGSRRNFQMFFLTSFLLINFIFCAYQHSLTCLPSFLSWKKHDFDKARPFYSFEFFVLRFLEWPSFLSLDSFQGHLVSRVQFM